VRQISEDDVRALALTPRAWREAVFAAYERYAGGRVRVAPKSHLRPSPGELLLALPAVDLDRGYSACKWVNVVPAARTAGGPTVNSVLLLNDWRTGKPLALIAADELTAARTAAMSAIAAARYARRDSDRIGFVGCGVQARSHLAALRDVLPGLRHATVHGRRIEAARAFADEMRARRHHGAQRPRAPLPRPGVARCRRLRCRGRSRSQLVAQRLAGLDPPRHR